MHACVCVGSLCCSKQETKVEQISSSYMQVGRQSFRRALNISNSFWRAWESLKRRLIFHAAQLYRVDIWDSAPLRWAFQKGDVQLHCINTRLQALERRWNGCTTLPWRIGLGIVKLRSFWSEKVRIHKNNKWRAPFKEVHTGHVTSDDSVPSLQSIMSRSPLLSTQPCHLDKNRISWLEWEKVVYPQKINCSCLNKKETTFFENRIS